MKALPIRTVSVRKPSRLLRAPTWALWTGLRALFGHIGPVEQKWTVDDVIAEADRVVVRATNCCTQEEFFGVPAGGKRQVFTATFTFRIVDRLIAEVWRNADDLGRLLQLGARIAPGEG